MTEDQQRFGTRLLALTGLWFLLTGLLLALSFVVVALVLTAFFVLGAACVLVARRLREIDAAVAFRTVERATRSALEVARTRAPRPRVRQRARRVAGVAKAGARSTPARGARSARRALDALYRIGVLRVDSLDPAKKAMELNEVGTRLRRNGEPEHAAERHLAALEIVRDLGDERAEAATLNNLGLALAQSGADDAAVEHLERAVDVLRRLGDAEQEARVMANLGLLHSRKGHRDEASMLLHEALDKLPPQSPVYRRVERELVRTG